MLQPNKLEARTFRRMRWAITSAHSYRMVALLSSSIQDLWAISVEIGGQRPSPKPPPAVAEPLPMRNHPSH